MNCPKCTVPMEKVEFKGVEVDRCTHCKGIWFDALEKEKLKALPGSETIDVGSPKEGKDFDKLRQIDCPVCNVPMTHVADPHQRHIGYEICKSCRGAFLDAGEYRDFKEETFFDVIRGLFTS